MGILQRTTQVFDTTPRRVLVAWACIAAVLGLQRIWSRPINFQAGQTDNFWPIANHLLDGQGYSLCYPLYFPFCAKGDATPTAMREPVPVIIYAAVAWSSGRSLLATMHVQVLMCVLIVFLTYRFTRAMAGTRAALLAALAWAIYLPAVEIESQLSADLIGTCLLMCSANVLLWARRRGTLLPWALAGALLGAAALSRSALLLMLLPWCLFACWTPERGFAWRTSWPHASLLAVSMFLVISPWAIRNHNVFGRWWMGTSMNGYNVWRMSSQVGTDEPLHYVDSFEADTMSHELLARSTDLRGDENEAEMDRIYMEEGMRQVKKNPAKYLRLCAFRCMQLLTNVDVKSTYGIRLGLIDRVSLAQQLIFLALATVGMAFSWRRQWPWIAAIAVQVAGYSALVAQWRYAIPIMPLFIAFAATALARVIWRKARLGPNAPEA